MESQPSLSRDRRSETAAADIVETQPFTSRDRRCKRAAPDIDEPLTSQYGRNTSTNSGKPNVLTRDIRPRPRPVFNRKKIDIRMPIWHSGLKPSKTGVIEPHIPELEPSATNKQIDDIELELEPSTTNEQMDDIEPELDPATSNEHIVNNEPNEPELEPSTINQQDERD